MRTWQWLALPVGIGVSLCIVAYPFTRYPVIVDLDQAVVDENGNLSGGFMGWKNGFMPILEIKRLNDRELKFGVAQPNWLVVIFLVGLAVSVSSFIFGFRPKGDPLRKEAMIESVLAFTALGLATVSSSVIVIYGFSWRVMGRTVVLALFGIVLLWLSRTSRSRRKQVKSKVAG